MIYESYTADQTYTNRIPSTAHIRIVYGRSDLYESYTEGGR